MSKDKKIQKTSVGGQALIEGILMIGPKGAAMSLRLPDGTIETSRKEKTALKDKYKLLAYPVLRGFVNFVETMIFGYKCMMESAEKSVFEEPSEKEAGSKIMSFVSLIAVVLGFAISMFLFFWLPTYAVDMFDQYVTKDALANFHPLFEGIIRIGIFVVYIAAVALMKDIKRVFMYHGAEHKSIACYEEGSELTVQNVKKQSRYHPRCGTSFIFVMLIISIIISFVITTVFPDIQQSRLLWTATKLMLVPIVISLGYEFIKYAGCHDNFLVRVLSAPGLWMQRLTTKEPTDDIIEVAIQALKAVIIDDPEDDEIDPPPAL